MYTGREGLPRFLSELQSEGVEASLSSHSFDEVGGRVVVAGSLRRRTPSEIAERTAAWALRFDDQGRVACIDACGTRL